MIFYCAMNSSVVWLLLVYGFKGILLIFGLFLAWETRKVKIAALNDSHHIGKLSEYSHDVEVKPEVKSSHKPSGPHLGSVSGFCGVG